MAGRRRRSPIEHRPRWTGRRRTGRGGPPPRQRESQRARPSPRRWLCSRDQPRRRWDERRRKTAHPWPVLPSIRNSRLGESGPPAYHAGVSDASRAATEVLAGEPGPVARRWLGPVVVITALLFVVNTLVVVSGISHSAFDVP